jgi:hypothetical protein
MKDKKEVNANTGASTQSYIASSFIPSPYHPSVTPFSQLTNVSICELVLKTHHRGKYLLVRCATRQDRMTGILAIVQDESSDALLLQLYYQEQANDPVETSSRNACS